jgi:CDP-glucose 4,6-dehydratase
VSFNWKDRRVLVTGATGFIGSWLTETLLKNGSDVSVFVKEDDPLGMGGLSKLSGFRKFKGDIRNKEDVKDAVKNQEIIFHLAAVTQVVYAVRNPVETFDVNAVGTMNILEAIRNSNTEQFLVFASTDKVYGEPKYLPIDENHPLLGKSPYDASKIAADRLVFSYYTTYDLKSSISRWSNTIGGRDSNILRAGPSIILPVINGKQPVIRYTGEEVRDYMYVEDAVSAMLSLAQNQNASKGEAFNFGTGNPTKIKDFAKLVIKLAGFDGKLEPEILNKPSPGEIVKQYLSSEKSKKMLKWMPKFTLEDGLKLTIDWFRKNKWWVDVIEKVSKYYRLDLMNIKT